MRRHIVGAIGGLVGGIAIGIGVFFYYKFDPSNLLVLIGVPAAAGAIGALLGGIFGVDLV